MELKNINIRMEVKLAEQFKAFCKKEGLKQAKTIEKLIAEFLAKQQTATDKKEV